MKNKIVRENLCYGLIEEIERINKFSYEDSKELKKEILQSNFKRSFNKVAEAIEYELKEKIELQRIDSILSNLQEKFEYTRQNLNNDINSTYEENDSTYSVVAILNRKVEDLVQTIESVEDDNKYLEQANEIFMTKMNNMEHTLSEERQYSTSKINDSISYNIEDKIMTQLAYEIKSTLLSNSAIDQNSLDELEYQVNYILNSNLKSQTLDEFYDVDRKNIENIQEKEATCFKEVKRVCMNALKNQVEEGLENKRDEQEKKSSTLDLSDLVNDEKQAGVQTDLREEQERMKEDKVMSLPSNVIY